MKKFLILWLLLSGVLSMAAQEQNSPQFDRACSLLSTSYKESIAAFEQVHNDPQESTTMHFRAIVVLANIYTRMGMADKVQEQADRLQVLYDGLSNKQGYRNVPYLISDYRRTVSRMRQKSQSFNDRISGLWVSAEADENGCPCMVLAIGYSGEYWAAIVPGTKFASYMGSDGLYTTSIAVDANQHPDLHMYFGSQRFRSPNSSLLSELSRDVEAVSRSSSEAVAVTYRDKPMSAGNIGGQVVSNIVGGLAQGIIGELSVAKTHTYVCDIEGTFDSGVEASVTIYYTDYYERSDENRIRQYGKMRKIHLYKMADDDPWCFVMPTGKTISLAEAVSQEQLDFAAASTEKPRINCQGVTISVPAFNAYAWQRLTQKVLPLTNSETAAQELEYGPKGYCFTTRRSYLNSKKYNTSELSGAYYRKNGDFMDTPDYYAEKKAFIRHDNRVDVMGMGPTMEYEINKKTKNFIPMEEDKRKKKKK